MRDDEPPRVADDDWDPIEGAESVDEPLQATVPAGFPELAGLSRPRPGGAVRDAGTPDPSAIEPEAVADELIRGACPFLDDRPGAPGCTAFGEPVTLAARQRELVCLTADHVACPRYARGISGASTPTWSGPARSGLLGPTWAGLRNGARPATALAVLLLLASFGVAFTYVALNGGLSLPAGALPSASPVAAVASPSPSASTAASPPPTATPEATPTPSQLAPSPVASPSASTPGESPGASAAPSPTVDKLSLLTPCPGKPNCYQYRIRSGDNLRNVASFFGVPYASVLSLNPQITNPSVIHVGQIITLPTPKP